MAHSYQLFEPPDGQYGAPVGNGSWNGMVSMLIKGEVDIAVGPFTITPERKSVIDFTAPFMEDGGGILTKGGDQGVDMMNVFRPFPLEVWLMTGAAIFVTAIILYVITRVGYPRRFFQDNRSRVNNDRSRENNDNSDDNEPLTLADCLLVIFGSLMSQGAHRHPKASAGRLVLGFWWLFTILIVSIYTASFTAILTVTVNADTIDSIDDLAASDLDPITVAGTNWHTMFLVG